jgi:hypothetical protein
VGRMERDEAVDAGPKRLRRAIPSRNRNTGPIFHPLESNEFGPVLRRYFNRLPFAHWSAPQNGTRLKSAGSLTRCFLARSARNGRFDQGTPRTDQLETALGSTFSAVATAVGPPRD